MMDQNQETDTVVPRGTPKVSPEEQASVTVWLNRVQAAEAYWKPNFDRMRQNMELARTGASPEWTKDNLYVVNLINRHINNSVADLYARNPKVSAKPRDRMWFEMWDGDVQQLAAAVQPSANPDYMQAQAENMANAALLRDVQNGKARHAMAKGIAETTEKLINYYWSEQMPPMKPLIKKLVRRAKVTGVGYIDVGWQRLYERRPEISARIADVMQQIQSAERLSADIADNESDNLEFDKAELQATLRSLQAQENVIVRQGLFHDFPQSTAMIPDPECYDLTTWTGANWLARRYTMTANQVQEMFGVDVGTSYEAYREGNEGGENRQTYYRGLSQKDNDRTEKGMAVVYRIQDKSSRTERWICAGYPAYIKAPQPLDIQIETFFTTFALTFNDVETETGIFPLSDVDFMRHPQNQYNCARQSEADHRYAARPRWVGNKGAFLDKEKDQLASSAAHSVILLEALGQGQKINDLLEPVPVANINPQLYETGSYMRDIFQGPAGGNESAYGITTSQSTATEATIAQGSTNKNVASNQDDLDQILTNIAQADAQILLQHLTADQAKEIVGPGAIWPNTTVEESWKQIIVNVKAGSSGRPNQAMEAAIFNRIMPILLQVPGITPRVLAEKGLDALDSNIDLDMALADGLPSIQALNAQLNAPAMGPTGGGPAPDAMAQGNQGGQNMQQTPENDIASGENVAQFPSGIG